MRSYAPHLCSVCLIREYTGKKMIRIIAAAFILIFALSCEAQAKLYTWTDEDGVAHISNQPPDQEETQTPRSKKKIEREPAKETHNSSAENWLKIPGTKISMNPPPGFIAADHFPGFFHPEADSSIMVTEMPGPYSEITKGFNKVDLSAQGMSLIEKKPATVCENDGLLIHISQAVQNRQYEKWVVAFGSQDETSLVAAIFPQELRDQLSNTLRSCILGIRCSSDSDSNLLEGLAFSIYSTPKMKFARRMGNTLTMTKDGGFPAKNKTDPLLVAGASISPGLKIDDKKSFAMRRIRQTATLRDLEVLDVKEITIDGLAGYEITARGTDKKHGGACFAYQVILYGESDYYLIVGIVSADEKAEYLPAFKQIAMTFKRK